MTGQDIINFFQNLIDETVNVDFALDLLANAKDLIEADRIWRMLIKEDSSQTFGSSDTYLTAKNLPSDFFTDHKVFLGIESEDDYKEYDPVPFEWRRKHKSSQVYAIDYANKKIYICGDVDKTYTIYIYYVYETPAITLTTSPIWPAKFHKLIAFMMAELYQVGVNYDEITARQAIAHSRQGTLLYNAMVEWDSKLWAQAMGKRAGFASEGSGRRTNVIQELE